MCAMTSDREVGFGARLTVDLGAIADNYRRLAKTVRPATCAAAVKADAYGLGVAHVGPALAAAGCRDFFVAHLAEGIGLRRILGGEANIYVLHGPLPGHEAAFLRDRLVPVLNSAAQVAAWMAVGGPPAVLQIDTGMSRLGLPAAEFASARDLRPRLVMSHLACADDAANPANARQRDAFVAARSLWEAPGSLAASSGIFLGAAFHFDLVRPGAALYGLSPYGLSPHAGANPMHRTVTLHAAIVQTRDVEPGDCVGYGYSFTAERPMRLATVGIGYADGVMRSLSNRGCAYLEGVRLPMVGRVSMDSITLDISALAATPARGTMVELIGPHLPPDAVAATAGTIGYELLTALGPRFDRSYCRAA